MPASRSTASRRSTGARGDNVSPASGCSSNEAEVAPRTQSEIEAYKQDAYGAEEEEDASANEEGALSLECLASPELPPGLTNAGASIEPRQPTDSEHAAVVHANWPDEQVNPIVLHELHWSYNPSSFVW